MEIREIAPVPPLARWTGKRAPPPAVPPFEPPPPARQAATAALPAPSKDSMPERALPTFRAFPAATRALLAARGMGALAAQLEAADAAWLEGLARRALPRVLAEVDPALRTLVLEDARRSPALPARFDARNARAAAAFAFARAVTLPALAVQGGATTLKALRIAFLRGALKPHVGHREVASLVDAAEALEEVPLPAVAVKVKDYERFEEETLVPWVRTYLRNNAPPVEELRDDLAERRREQGEQRAALLESLDADQRQVVMGLRKAGAWTDADYERLAAEADANAARWDGAPDEPAGAGAGSDSDGDGGDDEGYNAGGDDGGEGNDA